MLGGSFVLYEREEMTTLFTVLVLASVFVIVVNFFWMLVPSNRTKINRPFLWFEWVAFLVAASVFSVHAYRYAAWLYIVAAFLYLSSYSSYKDWQKWLDFKSAVPNETD